MEKWSLFPPFRRAPRSRWRRFAPLALLALLALGGCERRVELQYSSSTAVAQLDPPFQQVVVKELQERCGTPALPKLLGEEVDAAQLQHGEAVYRRYCQQCHGVTGDGNGPAAEYLEPRPRDYRKGIFKFTSTPYGAKPLREDLLKTIQRGITGTSMPSFRLLPERDLQAVVSYVLALTRRGELENKLVELAENATEVSELTPEEIGDQVNAVLAAWTRARNEVVEPATKMPPITAETIAAGADIFQKRECYKCHGRGGRGGIASGIEVGNDSWGRKAPAADLTTGMLHGGQTPLDVYRRISSGINGTPMPAFKDSFAESPDSIWMLTHYVLALADQRRRGQQFPPEPPAADAGAGQSVSTPPAGDTTPPSADK